MRSDDEERMAVTRGADDRPTVIEAFRAGSEFALAEVYARWSPLVYSVALGSLGNVADAEKVTQRVFTEAWTSRQTFNAKQVELSAWLIGITRNRIADARAARDRSAQPQTTTMTGMTQLTDKTAPVDLAARLVLVDEVSRLDAVPQQVLRMALYDDLDHAQIAERTGLPPAAVIGHIGRSLLKLRTRLEVLTDAY